MSTRASNARHVRQRKLNTKQPLRIIRENEVEEIPDDDSQRNIPQVETGVEKGEEVVSCRPPSLTCKVHVCNYSTDHSTGVPSASRHTRSQCSCFGCQNSAELHSYPRRHKG